jgi:hypothetical protein
MRKGEYICESGGLRSSVSASLAIRSIQIQDESIRYRIFGWIENKRVDLSVPSAVIRCLKVDASEEELASAPTAQVMGCWARGEGVSPRPEGVRPPVAQVVRMMMMTMMMMMVIEEPTIMTMMTMAMPHHSRYDFSNSFK